MPISLVSSNSSSQSSSVTSHSVALPSGIRGGDRLLVFFGSTAPGVTPNVPAGWSQRAQQANAGGGTAQRDTLTVFERFADGSEGPTLTVTTSSGSGSVHVSYCIRGHKRSQALETASASSGGSFSSPNPPAISPSWGTKSQSLLIVAALGVDSDDSVNSYPTNYSLGQRSVLIDNGGTLNGGLGVAARVIKTTSDDPGTFNMGSGITIWVAFTLAIREGVKGLLIALN